MIPMSTSPQAIYGFNNLALLSLDACHKLKYLFSPSIAKLLVKLKEVKISQCKIMKQLVKREKEESSILSPKANSLKLLDNPSSSHATSIISQESCNLEFPSLERISIINCSMLGVVIDNGEWTTNMTTFDQVKSLTLSHLPNLVSLCHQSYIPEQPDIYRVNDNHRQDEVTNS